MKHLFIRFDVNNGFSVKNYRSANAVACIHNDIADFLQGAKNEVNSCVGFDKDFAIRLLEDCYYWQGSDITHDTLEIVYRLIKDYDHE